MVTVAVVSWNTRELLLRCLRSLRAEVDSGRAEVWVVDNGSEDGSADAAQQTVPWANVVQADQNLGYGRAVNLVAARSRSPWLLAANADICLTPGALGKMLEAGRDPRVGCVVPRLVLADGETEHSVHPLPTLPLTLAFNLGLHRVSRAVADRLCLEGYWNSDRPRAVPWAIGACLLLRREAFDQIGGFHERQWLYAEDLDLGWRLHECGWLTWFEPQARVEHQSGAATSRAFGTERGPLFMAATYSMLRRRRGAARMWITAVMNIAGAAGRLAWMAPLAAVCARWREPRERTREWLRAHVRGLQAVVGTSDS